MRRNDLFILCPFYTMAISPLFVEVQVVNLRYMCTVLYALKKIPNFLPLSLCTVYKRTILCSQHIHGTLGGKHWKFFYFDHQGKNNWQTCIIIGPKRLLTLTWVWGSQICLAACQLDITRCYSFPFIVMFRYCSNPK